MRKFFRVAASGKTIDGREISPEMLKQAAETFDPEKYPARINLEHYRGLLPDGPFKSYGDVVSLKTEEQDGLTILLAELDPTKELVALNKDRQKIYTSVELTPDFKGNGKWYLSGLAITDSPASTHVEALKFSIEARKDDDKAPYISEFSELEGLVDEDKTVGKKLADTVSEMLSRVGKKTDQQYKQTEAAVLKLTEALGSALEEVEQLTAAVEDLQGKADEFIQLSDDFTALKASLEQEAGGTERPEHKGSSRIKTNC